MAARTPSRSRSNGNGNQTNRTTGEASGINIEIGLSGLVRSHGIVSEEFLPNLKGKKAIEIWKEMRDNDPIVGALLFAIEKMLRQVKWFVEQAGESPEHEKAAQFLTENMDDMSMTWGDVISEAASMFPFGWALCELCYKRREGPDGEHTSKYNDGRIGWWKMPIRSQESLHEWVFSDAGGIRAMIQRPAPDYRERPIPIEKALLFRTSIHKNNPEGRSILRNAYRPWFFKKRIEEIEGIGVERDLAGLPVMYLDPRYMAKDAKDAEKAVYEEYKEMIVNIRRDKQEGVLLPAIFDKNGNRMVTLELLTSGGSRAFDTDGIIVRYERAIAMTVLADWLMLGHSETGSWALSSDKTSLFSVALGAWLDMMASVFNDYAVPRLFKLNGFTLDQLPQIKYGDVESPDLAALGTYINMLSTSGVPLFPNPNLVEALLKAANLPVPTDEDKQAQEELQAQLLAEQEELSGLTE